MHTHTCGALGTLSVEAGLCNLTDGRRDGILVSLALYIGAFSLIQSKSPTLEPHWWYKDPRIKQGDRGGQEDGVTLNFAMTTLILNTCLIIGGSTVLCSQQPWKACVCLNFTPLCTPLEHLSCHEFRLPRIEKQNQLILSWANSHTLTQVSRNSSSFSSCFCTAFSLNRCLMV